MIVISYKGRERLIPTLESHKLQTYPDKELIIADDASPDGITQKIIEDWLSENERYFKRVVFIKNPVNLGAVQNFKTAALQATGDVIFQTEQGDVVYGPQTMEKLSDEIEKQRLNGLKDPYMWLGHFRSFSCVNGKKINKNLRYCSQPEHFDLVEKFPDKALTKMIRGNFIGGPSLILSSRYFDGDIYPHLEKSRNMGDYPCLLWNLINEQQIGVVRQFIHWYEDGVGISQIPNPKMIADRVEIYKWMRGFGNDEMRRKLDFDEEYGVRCKNRWQRMTRHPLAFSKNVAHFVWNKLTELSEIKNQWIPKVAENSSPSFSDELFSPENYPPRPEGIF